MTRRQKAKESPYAVTTPEAEVDKVLEAIRENNIKVSEILERLNRAGDALKGYEL